MTSGKALQEGIARHRAGRLPEAEAAYRRVLAAQPGNPDALHLLGVIAHQTGKLDAAAALIGEAVAKRPGFAEARSNLGNVLKDQGRLDEAAAAYRGALQSKPDYPEAHNNLGNALAGQGRLEEAMAAYRDALRSNPGYAEAHNNLGVALTGQGRPGEAETALRRALGLSPGFAEAHNNLGNALKDQGRPRDAAAAYRAAIAARPDYANAYYNLHAAIYDDTDPGAAIDALENAVRAEPGHEKAQFHLGVLRDLQGDSAAAAACFATLTRDEAGYNPGIDSWNYVKSRRRPSTRFFGCAAATLKFCVARAESDGAVLEFGVRFGTSIGFIAGAAGRTVHGFDSFQGLPEAWRDIPRGAYTTGGALPDVPPNVRLHIGLFQDTIPAFVKECGGPVRFMNVDCDIYSSTRTILDLLGDRIVRGTVIVFDEYLINENWREDEYKAFQEAVGQYNWEYKYIAFNLFTKQAAVQIL